MTKELHFIWFQGWEALPVELRGITEHWQRLNPDYSVRRWDEVSLLQFVRTLYPEYLQFYLSIGDGEERNVRTIKRCDFARLLLLLRYGGWYIDTDCVPLRPMDEFLACGEVHHRFTPFSYSRNYSIPTVLPHDDPEAGELDLPNYEVIFSREHLYSPALTGYPVSNTVMYARPGASVMADLIDHCVGRESNKVLQFAGPHALSEWVRPRVKELKGRVLVLPPYYFLWQPHDMGAPWGRTVACHLNRLDWTDKSQERPWDI